MRTTGRTQETHEGVTPKGHRAVWVFPLPADSSAVRRLVDGRCIPPTVAEIMCRRFGERLTDDDVDALLRPAFRNLHDPYLYTGMERAAKRMAKAVRDRNR